MSHLRIPANWKVKRSTPFFTKDNSKQHCFLTITLQQAFLASFV